MVDYPDAIAEALSQLRLVGVNGPYSVVMGADAYTALSEASDHGYPVIQHIQRLVNEEIILAPAIAGAFVLTTRGGDFDLHIGQDVSIGYLSHSDTAVTPVPAGNANLPPADCGSGGSADARGGSGTGNRRAAETGYAIALGGMNIVRAGVILSAAKPPHSAARQNLTNSEPTGNS